MCTKLSGILQEPFDGMSTDELRQLVAEQQRSLEFQHQQLASGRKQLRDVRSEGQNYQQQLAGQSRLVEERKLKQGQMSQLINELRKLKSQTEAKMLDNATLGESLGGAWMIMQVVSCVNGCLCFFVFTLSTLC